MFQISAINRPSSCYINLSKNDHVYMGKVYGFCIYKQRPISCTHFKICWTESVYILEVMNPLYLAFCDELLLFTVSAFFEDTYAVHIQQQNSTLLMLVWDLRECIGCITLPAGRSARGGGVNLLQFGYF